MLGILLDLQGTYIPPLTIVTPLRLAQAKKPEHFFPVPVVSGTGPLQELAQLSHGSCYALVVKAEKLLYRLIPSDEHGTYIICGAPLYQIRPVGDPVTAHDFTKLMRDIKCSCM